MYQTARHVSNSSDTCQTAHTRVKQPRHVRHRRESKIQKMEALVVPMGVSVPVAYLASRSSVCGVKYGVTGAIWLLYYQALEKADLPPRTITALMGSALGGMQVIKITQMILFPNHTTEELKDPAKESIGDSKDSVRDRNDSIKGSKGSTDSKDSKDSNTRPPESGKQKVTCNRNLSTWQMVCVESKHFVTFAAEFFWFFLPIRKNSSPWEWSQIGVKVLECSVAMGVKYIASPLIFTLLMYKSGLQPDGSCAVNIDSGSRPQFDAITYMTINTTYLLAILCNPEDDFQCMLVPVLTLGRYSKLPFNNYVFLSSSLREFWGGRYNLLVSSLLRQAVFTPAKKKGYSNSISSLMAFAASGALHMLVAHYTFGYGMIRTMGFFLLQPLIISLEMYIESRYPWLKAKCPPFARCILTMSVFCLTCPLYVGLFTEAMPEFLVNCNRDVKLPTWAVVCSDWIGKAVFGMAVHPLILAGVDAPLKAKTE